MSGDGGLDLEMIMTGARGPHDDDDARQQFPESLLRQIRVPPPLPTPAQLKQLLLDYAIKRHDAASIMGVALVTLIRYLRPPTSKQNRPINRIRFQALEMHVERMRQEQEAGAAAVLAASVDVMPSLPEPPPVPVSVAIAAPDNRRTCLQCAGRKPIGGLCSAARRGLLVGRDRNYVPAHPDELHRCTQYIAGRDDPDRRSAAARWPVEGVTP